MTTSGYHILGGVVPPYQVLQQQNAGLPPGGVPPWYAMQYPAGYVPPLLVSVDNPFPEGDDPFNTFDLLRRHHDEREQRDLARGHLLGAMAAMQVEPIADTITAPSRVIVSPRGLASTTFENPLRVMVYGGTRFVYGTSYKNKGPKAVYVVQQDRTVRRFTDQEYLQVYDGKSVRRGRSVVGAEDVGAAHEQYDVATVVRALNAIYFTKSKDGRLVALPVSIAAADALAQLGKKAIEEAIRIAPRGAFIPQQDAARGVVQGKIQWHVDRIAEMLRTNASTAPYPHADDLRKWVTSAVVEYNAAADGAQYVKEKVSYLREITEQVNAIAATLANELERAAQRGIASIVPWWAWALGGLALAGAGVFYLLPVIAPALARTATAVGVARESVREIRG